MKLLDMKNSKLFKKQLVLLLYDVFLLLAVDLVIMAGYKGSIPVAPATLAMHIPVSVLCVITIRVLFGIYRQIWRFGGIQVYIRLFFSDLTAGLLYLVLNYTLLPAAIAFTRLVSVCCMNLLAALIIRMMYRYSYKFGGQKTTLGAVLRLLLRVFTFNTVEPIEYVSKQRIRIAIVGAGRTGVLLAEELFNNPGSAYLPCCFVEIDDEKIGRVIHDIPVVSGKTGLKENLEKYNTQEVVFAVPELDTSAKKALYADYSALGYRVRVYDFPLMEADGKRHLRDFDVEELLFRKTVSVLDEKTKEYYRGKTVMVTGAGGSIGSELCRQLALMQPKQLILLDICENGVYDVQQELRIAYGTSLDVQIAIVSVTNRRGLERVFTEYRPQIVVHAAAHKHVPLMEKDCVEAVENNVFGTLNTIEVSEEFGVERFIMVSTDKAVNPTNVMGATKRLCEIIAMAHSRSGCSTTFSATRFGNVLGSAGSVIPLFRRQIASGGPITVTDKRIIRYFMTIPEASQLVLQSGAMAKNGELFVLDMGEPVKILNLAENMIRLAGLRPYKDIDIIETGLRPGEKLYEELLVKTELMDKTENDLIFIEHDEPIGMDELEEKLELLREAVYRNENADMKEVMRRCVPSFVAPETLNAIEHLSAVLTK